MNYKKNISSNVDVDKRKGLDAAKEFEINIRQDGKFILYTPPHTASRRVTSIFENLDFSTFRLHNDSLVLHLNSVTHTHSLKKIPNYKDYKTIMTVRNPYMIILARYKFSLMEKKKILSTFNIKNSFKTYLDFNPRLYGNTFRDLAGEKMDFKIRQENILDDILKLPFVMGLSDQEKIKIEKASNEKIGESKSRLNYNLISPLFNGIVSSLYDQEYADLVYDNNKIVFEIMGYERDSWMDLSNSVF